MSGEYEVERIFNAQTLRAHTPRVRSLRLESLSLLFAPILHQCHVTSSADERKRTTVSETSERDFATAACVDHVVSVSRKPRLQPRSHTRFRRANRGGREHGGDQRERIIRVFAAINNACFVAIYNSFDSHRLDCHDLERRAVREREKT